LDEAVKTLDGGAMKEIFRVETQRSAPPFSPVMPKPAIPDSATESIRTKEALPVGLDPAPATPALVQPRFEAPVFKSPEVKPPVVAAPSQVSKDAIATVPTSEPKVTAIQPSITSRTLSKNPFDSLEDEMAKLLGRAPEGKG
jgi:hypothetical protein